MKILLKRPNGESIPIDVNLTDTFNDLKDRIHEESGIELDVENLIFNGEKIHEEQNVLQCFNEVKCNDPIPNDNIVPSLYCAVPGCNNTQSTNPDKVFFRFPLQEERCNHWLLVCRRQDLMGQSSAYLNHYHAVCSDHFIADLFTDASKLHLKKTAVPTKFPFDALDRKLPDKYNVGEVITEEISSDNVQKNRDSDFLSDSEDCDWDEENDEFEDEEEEENWLCDDEEATHPGVICRLCAKKISDVVYIFSENGKQQNLLEKIYTCLPIKVHCTDHLPKQICTSCIIKLNSCYDFVKSSIEADDKLRVFSKMKKFSSQQSSNPVDPELDINNILDKLTNEVLSYHEYPEKKSEEEFVMPSDQNNSGKNCSSTISEPIITEDSSYCKDVLPSDYVCPLCCDGAMKQKNHIPKISAKDESDTEESNYEKNEDLSYFDNVCLKQEAAESEKNSDKWEERFELNGKDFDQYYDLNGSKEIIAENAGTKGGSKCRICGETFANIELCLQHSKEHSDSVIFPCNLCNLAFSNELELVDHFDIHKVKPKTGGRLHCHTCGRKFNNERTLGQHTCVVTPRLWKCCTCGKQYTSELRLVFHQQTHNGLNCLICQFCKKEFTRENNLFEHIRLVHFGEKSWTCAHCGKSFQLKSRLIAHERVHTGERPFECEVCCGKFYDGASLRAHKLTHTDVKPFVCDICGRTFKRSFLFNAHMESHQNGSLGSSQKHSKICRYCPMEFTTHALMIQHMKTEHPNMRNEKLTKPFTCEECGKSFAYRVTLITHQRNHSGDLPFSCEFCEKRFTQKRSLILHRRTHTGEKPFECNECGKTFIQSAHLYAHLRLHSGEKPYACDFCDAKFRLKDVRDSHRRKHTGERPFQCQECNKAFRTSHTYYQHLWIHQGKRPYPCTYCGKAFRRSNGLKVHIRIHTGEKPHSCDICGRSFAQKQDMKKHRNLHTQGKSLSQRICF